MTEMPRDEPGRVWWRDGVIYQIYPRSFADSDGDGVGDLAGITARLDHVRSLGVDAIWLSPWFPSPNADWGYDVSDYLDVHPELGTLADADDLIARASEAGLRVVLDIVPNHTSNAHPWFVDSRSGPRSQHRDWYVWADGADGGPPNNWVSNFDPGRPAWVHDDASNQWYLAHFTPDQPDLNWWSTDVRAEFERILRYWFDRGTAGFRIDVCHMLVKDAALRDNPPAGPDDPLVYQLFGQRLEHNTNQPELHDVLRRWREIADSYDPERLLLGETIVPTPADYARFWGAGDELHTAYTFELLHAPFEAAALAGVVEGVEAALPSAGWPAWPLGNHDNDRYMTRWCDGDVRRARLAMLLVLTLRGTPLLYYGDEIGMAEVAVPSERLLDPVATMIGPRFGRDGCRTPMQWTSDADVGFGAGTTEPWLPYGDPTRANVADQEADPSSLLHFTRAAVAHRRAVSELQRGAFRTEQLRDGCWAYRRGDHQLVVLNVSPEPCAQRADGEIAFATTGRGGERVSGEVRLAPWEGAVIETEG